MKQHSANQTNRPAIPTRSISGHFIASEQAPAREWSGFCLGHYTGHRCLSQARKRYMTTSAKT